MATRGRGRGHGGGGGSGGNSSSSKLRGHPRDSPDVQLSKTLSYLLRHGAEKEKLVMRADGYVRVSDLVRRTRQFTSCKTSAI
jgi:2'-phosphotransferase